jgi:hypothetical protein
MAMADVSAGGAAGGDLGKVGGTAAAVAGAARPAFVDDDEEDGHGQGAGGWFAWHTNTTIACV